MAKGAAKGPTVASLKKVTPENLASLGVERLAELLVSVAETRPDLKRRLRMELAANQGPEHLAAEIDKRLGSLQTSRGHVVWRQKPAFVRDLDALRRLIAERLTELDPAAALDRLWLFLQTAQPVARRFRDRDRDGAVAAAYVRAAADLGRLLADQDPHLAANALIDAVAADPEPWAVWAPETLRESSAAMAAVALKAARGRLGGAAPSLAVVRALAQAAGDLDALRGSWSLQALANPSVAAALAPQFLAAGRVGEAGEILRAAAPQPTGPSGRLPPPDFAWESAWIDYLDQAGETAAAQDVRWASFERTLDVDRARSFTTRLADFDDVEAEGRAFAYAAAHTDFERGLGFLMAWPALAEAARMIAARPDDLDIDPAQAELWAAQLRRRFPAAAHRLLRAAAAAAFRRREFKLCDRLTEEADTIIL
ncbi:DUF6880 family protein [Phenylobacterium immobile]|uniref:DUF6880 family protein n=1 Tax=Phenylobacterium immobile TaxID=21 RepID=UPI000A4872A0|nr:DUF6880 family protein [Phenylobacterium immobile]